MKPASGSYYRHYRRIPGRLFLFFLISFPFGLFAIDSGSGEGSIKIEQDNSGDDIKLGLLLSYPPETDRISLSAYQGARLAISHANAGKGHRGRPFRLLVRNTEGLWGAGSKEAVKFVYDDEVSVIITSLDGRNAHLAEQVATKAHIVQIAARATDETLSQAYVPWFFRLVPNDKQQANALIDEIYRQRGHKKVSVLYEENYDYEMAAKTFEREAGKAGITVHTLGSFSDHEKLGNLSNIRDLSPEAIVIFSGFESARPVIEFLKDTGSNAELFGSLFMTMDGTISNNGSSAVEGMICVSSKFCFTTPGQSFKKAFQEQYGRMPDPAASYAYDAVSLAVTAIKKAGTEREAIRDTLAGMEYGGGVTGPIRFDENGNRTTPVFFIQIIKSHPVILPN